VDLSEVNINKPIFIVSPPRSGSSLIASLINFAGIFGGDMKPADEWNKKGYFENFQLRKILIDFLRENDSQLLYKRFHPVNLATTIEGLREIIVNIMLDEGINPGQRFFLKNFKMVFAWKSFYNSFPDAKWIFIERNQQNMINSMINAPFLVHDNENDWNEFIHSFNENIRGIKNYADTYTLQIENVLTNVDEVMKLFAFCDIEYNPEVLNLIDRSLIHE